MITWSRIVCAVDFSDASRAALEHAAELARRFHGELVLVHVARIASEERAHLVVVGTHGRTGFERAVLGSVADDVVRHSPCAVLVVRSEREWGD